MVSTFLGKHKKSFECFLSRALFSRVTEDLCYSLFYFHLTGLHIFVMCLVPGEIEGGCPRLYSEFSVQDGGTCIREGKRLA